VATRSDDVVVQAERRKRVSPADAARVLALVSVLPVQIDARTAALAFSEIVATARAHRLSTYDASYLELARRLALPLATLDRDLATAAKRDGVTLLL